MSTNNRGNDRVKKGERYKTMKQQEEDKEDIKCFGAENWGRSSNALENSQNKCICTYNIP